MSQLESYLPAADIAEKQQQFPLSVAFLEELIDKAKIIFDKQIQFLLAHRVDTFWAVSEQILQLSQNINAEPLTPLVNFSIEMLKQQSVYMKSGEYVYSVDEYENAYVDIYNNPDVMEKYYLHGLLMTHAYWPIHLDMHMFFENEFLTAIPATATVGAEIGYGHGLYLLETLRSNPQTKALGFDVSQYALAFSNRVLSQNAISAERYDLSLGDVRDGLPYEDNALDWCIFAEVLEHIPNPDQALQELARATKPGCPIFVTTAANNRSVDHIWHFHNLEEVEDMLNRNGLKILSQLDLPLSRYMPNTTDPTINVAYICNKITA